MTRHIAYAVLALLANIATVPAISRVNQTPGQVPNSKATEDLKDPSKLIEKAPGKFKAKFVTTRGDFVIEVNRAWAPYGADRFYNLVKHGFYSGVRFYRVIPGFIVQFGIHGDPSISAKWAKAPIPDDARIQSNKLSFVAFVTTGPNTRTTQLFINLTDNARIDAMGYAPFGRISKGMEVVTSLYGGYGENLHSLQPELLDDGNIYLDQNYPKLDSIKSASIVK